MLSLNRFWNDSGNKPLDIREVSYAFLLPTFRPDVNVRVRNIFYSHTPDIQQRDSHVFFPHSKTYHISCFAIQPVLSPY